MKKNIKDNDHIVDDISIENKSDRTETLSDNYIDFELFRSLDYRSLKEKAVEMNILVGNRSYILMEIIKHLIGENKQIIFTGYLHMINNNYGLLRDLDTGFLPNEYDVYVSLNLIKKHQLRFGDKVKGILNGKKGDDQKHYSLIAVTGINDRVGKYDRVFFDNLTACYPTQFMKLENSKLPEKYNRICRTLDILTPVGFGSRGIIAAPPRAGKTTIVHAICSSVVLGYPNAVLIILLIGERPEEVHEMKQIVPNAIIIASTFDHSPQDHIISCEMTIEFAKRLSESGKDVILVMDSITRLVRSNNSAVPVSNRILSGGIDANALLFPRSFFGAARATLESGTLTILATNLIETGSRADELISEEFVGTENLLIKLSREIADKCEYPAIECGLSGTRRKESFIKDESLLMKMDMIKKSLSSVGISGLLKKIRETRSNDELLQILGIINR